MPFPWTLQRYLFREMGKTFLLAAIALTGVVGLGGGVLNMVKLGEATPDQLLRLMALVLPLAVALTLPMAALFAAAATYGRFSADNEFVACRSSGINMHVLFVPCVVMSLFAACVSFAFTNFVIPTMVRNINEFVGADVGALIQQRLNRPRGITLGGKYRIYADQCLTDPADPNGVSLRRIAFVEVDGGQWVRFGTAHEVRLAFERNESGIRVSGWMAGLSYYDRKTQGFLEAEEQTLSAVQLPTPVPQKIKFLNLLELFRYLSEPTEWYEVREELNRLRHAVGRSMAYDELLQMYRDREGTLVLSDKQAEYVVQSEQAALIPGGGGIELTGATVEERRADRRRWASAERAILEVTRGDTISESGVQIELYAARVSDGTTTVERTKVKLAPVGLTQEWVDRVEALTAADLLRSVGTEPDQVLARRRAGAREARAETVRRIIGAIHERTAFSVSVLVLVILGAALGIILRGAHVMMAFGISFVPLLFVIVTIVMGKQMSHNVGTHALGLVVLWSGIVIVTGLDVWTLTRVLRR